MSDPNKILETEFSEPFVQAMRNRMIMSYHKYGPLRNAYPEKVDAIGSLRDRLSKYAATGNTEFLVDAANFAMIEYLRPRHPHAHFRSTDDDESPGRRSLSTGRPDKRRNDEL